MKTALITGYKGFTGEHMARSLEAKSIRVIPLTCDITDLNAVRAAVSEVSPDWVIHLAALSFVALADEEAFYHVNVFGTLNVLKALSELSKPPEKILLASTANVYGTPAVELINESICPAPVNHYACSKLVMEHMASTWYDRLPIIITRPFNYTGPGQDERFLIPKIVSHFARKASFIELGNLQVSRDFSDVRDVSSAYLSLLKSDVQGVKVNVCSGAVSSLQDIIHHMTVIAGYEIEIKINQAFVRGNEIPVLKGDNALLSQLIGQVPSRPLVSTLQDMYAAMKPS
jgi:nucleoside-diphosphate-sugar epimerase